MTPSDAAPHRLRRNLSRVGELVHRGVWHPGAFEPQVDRETIPAVYDKVGVDLKACHGEITPWETWPYEFARE